MDRAVSSRQKIVCRLNFDIYATKDDKLRKIKVDFFVFTIIEMEIS